MKGNNELCLESRLAGWKYMDDFDRLPREVRDMLNASRFNICAACFFEQRRYRGAHWGRFDRYVDPELLHDFEYAIEHDAPEAITSRRDTRRYRDYEERQIDRYEREYQQQRFSEPPPSLYRQDIPYDPF